MVEDEYEEDYVDSDFDLDENEEVGDEKQPNEEEDNEKEARAKRSFKGYQEPKAEQQPRPKRDSKPKDSTAAPTVASKLYFSFFFWLLYMKCKNPMDFWIHREKIQKKKIDSNPIMIFGDNRMKSLKFLNFKNEKLLNKRACERQRHWSVKSWRSVKMSA